MPTPASPALVLSLDFELIWGVRDRPAFAQRYRRYLIGARRAIPMMLELFRKYDVSATWATVGCLFAKSRDELLGFWPELRPVYRRTLLDPYLESLGRDETEDPIHYASSLVDRIVETPGQEMGSHTFAHFYCLEPGATPEAFAADLKSAAAIASARGITLRSLVFPRNQTADDYLSVVRQHGYDCYRGTENGRLYRSSSKQEDGLLRRAARLADAYLPLTGPNTVGWNELETRFDLLNVRSSRFIRWWSRNLQHLEELRFQRIAMSLKEAAEHGRIAHLWLHPHNFGGDPERSLAMLERVLRVYRRLRDSHGMLSYSMSQVCDAVRQDVVRR